MDLPHGMCGPPTLRDSQGSSHSSSNIAARVHGALPQAVVSWYYSSWDMYMSWEGDERAETLHTCCTNQYNKQVHVCSRSLTGLSPPSGHDVVLVVSSSLVSCRRVHGRACGAVVVGRPWQRSLPPDALRSLRGDGWTPPRFSPPGVACEDSWTQRTSRAPAPRLRGPRGL